MNPITELAGVLCAINNQAAMLKFLSEIHTPGELRDISLRWRLMKMLKAGRAQRDIARELKISLCKITRGSKILKNLASVTNQFLKVNQNRKY